MRIVQVMGEINTAKGGVVRAVLDLSRGLAARGHDVTVLTRRNVDAPDDFVTPGENRLALRELDGAPGRLGALSASERPAVRDAVDGADVIHFHAVWHPVYLGIAREARMRNIPCVVSTHGMLDDFTMNMKPLKKRAYMAFAGRKLLRAMSVIHCSAQAELDQSRRWFGPAAERGRVLPLALDVTPYEQPIGQDHARERFGLGNKKVVLFLGRIHPIKGLEHLIGAMPAAHDVCAQTVLVLAGPHEARPYVERLRLMADGLGIADRVLLPGSVGGNLKVSLLKAATVFVLPSSHENFGLVVPEALICGTPAIVTKGVSIWRELESHGAAIATDQNKAAIGEALGDLLRDDGRRQRMGESGARWVKTELDPDAVLAGYENMYLDASSSRSALEARTAGHG